MDLALNLGLEDDDADDLFEDRLYQFCEIGGDGTHAAWWLNDAGEQQVVVISSSDSSGSLFATTTDFLRALAVGHFELGLGQMGLDDVDDESVNDDLKQWLAGELGLSVPACGQELALSTEPDPFLQWVAEVGESASTGDEADPTT